MEGSGAKRGWARQRLDLRSSVAACHNNCPYNRRRCHQGSDHKQDNDAPAGGGGKLVGEGAAGLT